MAAGRDNAEILNRRDFTHIFWWGTADLSQIKSDYIAVACNGRPLIIFIDVPTDLCM